MIHDEPAHLLDAAQIKIFLSIVETRSFSRSATVLGVKQSSISAQVKRIEMEFWAAAVQAPPQGDRP